MATREPRRPDGATRSRKREHARVIAHVGEARTTCSSRLATRVKSSRPDPARARQQCWAAWPAAYTCRSRNGLQPKPPMSRRAARRAPHAPQEPRVAAHAGRRRAVRGKVGPQGNPGDRTPTKARPCQFGKVGERRAIPTRQRADGFAKCQQVVETGRIRPHRFSDPTPSATTAQRRSLRVAAHPAND